MYHRRNGGHLWSPSDSITTVGCKSEGKGEIKAVGILTLDLVYSEDMHKWRPLGF